MEALNITFIKRNRDETLDVICVNGTASGLAYPYTDNTLSLHFTSGNTFVSTFDGGSQGFTILTENIKKVTGNLLSSTIYKNLNSAPVSGYIKKGSALTPSEEEFITKLKHFQFDISNAIVDTSKNLLRLNFASDLQTNYTKDLFKTSSLPKIAQYLTSDQSLQKILTDNFYIEGSFGRKKNGKGTVKLDKIFSSLFPYMSLGGEQRRRTLKKYT